MSLLNLSRGGYGGFSPAFLSKILKQLQSLDAPLLTGASANTLIPVGITPNDTIKRVIYFPASGLPSDITANVAVASTHAQGTITVNGIVAGDTITVAGKVLTASSFNANFTTGAVGPGRFQLGTDNASTAANIAKALNADGSIPVSATSNAAVVTVVANVDSTPGNSLTLAISAHGSVSGSTLAGGSATAGIKSTSDTSGGKLQVFWYADQPNVPL